MYEHDVKGRLLQYANTALKFGELGVNAHLISFNRTVLLHGPPGKRYDYPIFAARQGNDGPGLPNKTDMGRCKVWPMKVLRSTHKSHQKKKIILITPPYITLLIARYE